MAKRSKLFDSDSDEVKNETPLSGDFDYLRNEINSAEELSVEFYDKKMKTKSTQLRKHILNVARNCATIRKKVQEARNKMDKKK